jgi:cytosine/creatinine deaminase
LDLVSRNLLGAEQTTSDVGIEAGKIAAIQPSLLQARETIDVGGRLVTLDLIESHIHLDKSAILNRCQAERGDLEDGLAKKMVPRS